MHYKDIDQLDTGAGNDITRLEPVGSESHFFMIFSNIYNVFRSYPLMKNVSILFGITTQFFFFLIILHIFSRGTVYGHPSKRSPPFLLANCQ